MRGVAYFFFAVSNFFCEEWLSERTGGKGKKAKHQPRRSRRSRYLVGGNSSERGSARANEQKWREREEVLIEATHAMAGGNKTTTVREDLTRTVGCDVVKLEHLSEITLKKSIFLIVCSELLIH